MDKTALIHQEPLPLRDLPCVVVIGQIGKLNSLESGVFHPIPHILGAPASKKDSGNLAVFELPLGSMRTAAPTVTLSQGSVSKTGTGKLLSPESEPIVCFENQPQSEPSLREQRPNLAPIRPTKRWFRPAERQIQRISTTSASTNPSRHRTHPIRFFCRLRKTCKPGQSASFISRAPVFRFIPSRFRSLAKTVSTNSRLPRIAPSLK